MDVRIDSRSAAAPRAREPQAPKELQVKPELEAIADRYNSSRSLGNYASGALVGALAETATTVVQAPRLAFEMVENLWQAETLGPNLKILGTLAALPAAALSIPAAPFYGAFHGMSAVRHGLSSSDGPLVPDANRAVGSALAVRDGAHKALTMTGDTIASLEELGSRKLAEGEKPRDVPLFSPLFAVVGGAVSGVLSGAVGLACGLAAGAITGAKDIGSAFTDKQAGVGARIGRVAAAPLNLLAGPVLAWKSLKASVPQGLSDGWKHGPIRPITEGARFAAHLGSGVLHEAWEK